MKSSSPRYLALALLKEVNQGGAYANLALPKLLQKSDLDPRDKAFTQELAFGAIRWQLTYDAIINSVSSRPVEAIDSELLNCLRIGAHQLLNMRVPPHAAISETVDLVRQECGEGPVGFANGVLRRVSEKTLPEWIAKITAGKTDLVRQSLTYSHPEWIVSALKQSLAADGLQDDLEQLLETNNLSPKVNLVALPGLATRPENSETTDLNQFSPIGFSISKGNPELLTGFKEGFLRVQDEGSQLAALVLVDYMKPVEGEKWLDICAGPGGKAAILAAEAKLHSTTFTANELHDHRAKLVRDALKPFPAAHLTVGDGMEIGSKNPETFDRILLDAPCTGLGALRRRPEARWRKSNYDLKELTKLQFELLKSSYQALKPGGLLLYVTCSPHLSETTAIIMKASKELNVEVLNLSDFMNTKYFNGKLPAGRKTVQLHTQRDGTDSMFMALMTKPVRQ